jgi:hypothetical protein
MNWARTAHHRSPEIRERCTSAADLGGKGAVLDLLRRRGLPVPPGFVVPAEVYRAAARDPALLPVLRQLGAAMESGQPPAPSTMVLCDPRTAWLLAMLRRRIEASLAGWRRPLPAWYAVRSSATAEDGREHSFAGVLESFLAVAPAHLAEAVLLCWAAARTERFQAYCERSGLAPDGVYVGVVVQQMVPAQAAGVLLTHDPVSGESGPVINAIRGLGNALVQGDITLDEYRRRGGDPAGSPRTARVMAGKDSSHAWGRATGGHPPTPSERVPGGAVVLGKAGWEEEGGRQSSREILTEEGLVRAELAPEERGWPVLAPREREALTRLGQRVARIMGGPQDIEWAIAERRLWLLQARPITTLSGPCPVWTRANMKEIYPELPSPMTASLIERYERNWLVERFASRGFRVRHLGPSVRILHGRPYTNQSLMEAVGAAAGLDATTIRQAIGGVETALPGAGMTPDGRTLLRNALPLSRLLLNYLLVRPHGARVTAAATLQAEHLMRAPLVALDDAALLAGAVGAFQALEPLDAVAGDVIGALEVCSLLTTGLLKGVVAPPERFLAATTSSTEENVTARQVRDLEALIALGRASTRAREWLVAHDDPSPSDCHRSVCPAWPAEQAPGPALDDRHAGAPQRHGPCRSIDTTTARKHGG